MTNWICDIVLDLGNTDKINLIKDQVIQLCSKFPVYK
jgi:glycine hydroxymethyltransferase